MKKNPFERFVAWQRAMSFTEEIYRVTASFPKHEVYGLSSQLRRAAVSVTANIAEGTAKKGKRDFKRFLDIALGSLSEAASLLILAKRLGYLDTDAHEDLMRLKHSVGGPLWSLCRSMSED